MKRLVLIAFGGFLLTTITQAQVKASEVLLKLKEMPDQFDDKYDTDQVTDKLTLIYVPGSNNPFQKIYVKQKAANTVDNVLLVGGFKEMMGMMTFESKKKHLQEALAIRYKKGSTILLDMDSELGQMLSIGGYSIIELSRKDNRIVNVTDFGFDRVAFFKALEKYENKL